MFEFKKGTPESTGIPAQAVMNYVNALVTADLHLHSLLLIKNGTVIFEGNFAPMTSRERHRMYSCSKTFVSMTIGLLIQEGKLKLTDHVTDFFPEYDRETLHPWQLETTVRDILMMCDCHSENTYHMFWDEPELDWVDTWFKMKPSHRPGTIYDYSTECTVLLCFIIERLTGRTFVDILQERVFDPMGMSDHVECVRTPDGHPWGGSGLLLTTYDLAKFGYLIMHDGEVNGMQLLNRAYIREATAYQTANLISDYNIDARQGYGYQIWRIRNNGFAMFGMGSQQCYCFPDDDFMVVMNGDTQNQPAASQNEMNGISLFLMPALEKIRGRKDARLPEDPESEKALKALADGLEMTYVHGAHDSKLIPYVQGRVYRFPAGNEAGLKNACFEFDADGGVMTYENATGKHTLRFGYEKNEEQYWDETEIPGMDIGHPAGRRFHAYASGAWQSDKALHIIVYVSDVCFGSVEMTFFFKDDTLSAAFHTVCEWALEHYKGMTTSFPS